MSLVQRSFCAGAVIALTAMLRAACRGRLPRRMFVALWDLAVLRLLVPLLLPWAYAPRALMHAFLSHAHRQNAQAQQMRPWRSMIRCSQQSATAHTSLILLSNKISHAITGRQVTLRSLTAFL